MTRPVVRLFFAERWLLLMGVVLSGASLTPLAAQRLSGRAAFLEEVSRTVERLADPRTAISEGYRRLGPDFPGMGQHWIHRGLLVAGELDPRRPAALSYVTVDGESRIVGVAFTRVLGPEDIPPGDVFPRSAWHDHTQTVDEESLLLFGPPSMSTGGEFRLAMVHVWIPQENPSGTFAQNNWSLPFLRLGVRPPSSEAMEAARALSLVVGGVEFYKELMRDGLEMDGPELQRASDVFEGVSQHVDAWLEQHGVGVDAGTWDLAGLAALWDGLWSDLEVVVSEETYDRLAILR